MTNYSIISKEEYIDLVFPVFYKEHIYQKKLSFLLFATLLLGVGIVWYINRDLLIQYTLWRTFLILFLLFSIPFPKKILLKNLEHSIISTSLIHNNIELNENTFTITADSPVLFTKEVKKYRKIRKIYYSRTHLYLFISSTMFPLAFEISQLKEGTFNELLSLLKVKRVKLVLL